AVATSDGRIIVVDGSGAIVSKTSVVGNGTQVVAPQSGAMLLGGNGIVRRFFDDGGADPAFQPVDLTSLNGTVFTVLLVDASGRIVVAGMRDDDPSMPNAPVPFLVRSAAGGGAPNVMYAPSTTYALGAVAPDGRVLLSGGGAGPFERHLATDLTFDTTW